MYLEKRRKLYYALHDIPPSLRPAFGKKVRFVASLKTSEKDVAEIEAARVKVEWLKEIKSVRDRVLAAGDDSFARQLEMHAIALERSSTHSPHKQTPKQARSPLFDDIQKHVPPPKPNKAAQRFDAWLDSWSKLPSKKNKDKPKTPKTLHMAQTTIRRFADAMAMSEISRGRVQSWVEAEAEERSAATIRRSLSELRSYWSYLQARELVSGELLPFDRIQVPATDAAKRAAFPAAAISELVNAAIADGDTVLADVIRIGAFTGARIEEICSLKIDHVRWTHLIVEGTKTDAARRQVPIHPHLMPTIRRLADSASTNEDGYLIQGLIPNKFGDRSGAISKRFARLKSDVTLNNPDGSRMKFDDKYVFHSIRKTFSNVLWGSKGVQRELISQMMGHATGHITTDIYATDPDLDAKMRAIKKIKYPGYVPG